MNSDLVPYKSEALLYLQQQHVAVQPYHQQCKHPRQLHDTIRWMHVSGALNCTVHVKVCCCHAVLSLIFAVNAAANAAAAADL